MAKKRTKKQKQTARHSFTLSWKPSSSEAKSGSGVKRQFKSEAKTPTPKSATIESTVNPAQTNEVAKTRKNIIRSLILAGIILGTEVVLYFFWK